MSVLSNIGSGWILLGLLSHSAFAGEVRSSMGDQIGVAVTIYNEDLALVRDRRKLTLDIGRQDLAMADISARIRAETALLSSQTGVPALAVIEQNFDFDLLTPDTLLNKYVGKSVKAVSVNPVSGKEVIESAVVLATNQGLVLRFADRIETKFPGRIIFDQVPDNLREKPTLVMRLENSNPEPQEVQLSYLTSGLSWKADYVASLNQTESEIDLTGWVTLTNQSGARYEDALLQLVAGDGEQVQQALPRRSMVAFEAAAMSKGMEQESLFEYHLYTLAEATTVSDNQTKQVSLLSASQVPVVKQYVLDGQGQFYGGRHVRSTKLNVGAFLSITNDESSNLGIPLPGGVVRVYKNDSAGRVQFIGEERIDHSAKNQRLSLKLGNSFDVTAQRVQTDFKKVPNRKPYNFSAQIGNKISISNARDQEVTVHVRETIPGDWEMIAEDASHQELSSNTVEWNVKVGPDSTVEFEFVTLVRY